MKPIWKIRALAIALIVFFTLGTLLTAVVLVIGGGGPVINIILSLVVNLGFIVGGIGLLKLKRWAWWLTIVLCAVSIIQLLWQMFATLTPETATKLNEMIAYVVAGFYLAIVYLLASDSMRKTFWDKHDTAA